MTLDDIFALVQKHPNLVAGSARLEADAVFYSAEDFVRADLKVTLLPDGRIFEQWLNETDLDMTFTAEEFRRWVAGDLVGCLYLVG